MMLKNKKQWLQRIGALAFLTVCTACGPRPAAPVQNTEMETAAEAQENQDNQDNAQQEPQNAGEPDKKAVTVDGKQMTVIDDQSFDVTLEDWGDLRFLSCEPADGEGQIRFVLSRDGNTVYEFPAVYDDSEFMWKAQGVNFVTFPDLNGDGRKDAIMSMNLEVKDTKNGSQPFASALVYRSQGDQFVINRELTDMINESGHGGTLENIMKKFDKYWGQTSSRAADFSATVQECVRKDDKEKLAGLVRYPLTVAVKGKELTFKNERELIGRYEDVFHKKYKDAILAVDVLGAGTESKGYYLGDKLVTYAAADDGGFKITGLNSDLVKSTDGESNQKETKKQ